jgi:hypothetical protein
MDMLGLSSVRIAHVACLSFALQTSPLSVQALQSKSCLSYVSYATTAAPQLSLLTFLPVINTALSENTSMNKRHSSVRTYVIQTKQNYFRLKCKILAHKRLTLIILSCLTAVTNNSRTNSIGSYAWVDAAMSIVAGKFVITSILKWILEK